MLKLLPVAAALVLAGSPVYAADVPANSAQQVKMVCKRVTNTGWRLGGEKVCKPKAQWDAESRASRDEMRHNDGRRSEGGS